MTRGPVTDTAQFFRCTCGKLHTSSGTRPESTCTCGALLWPILINTAPAQ